MYWWILEGINSPFAMTPLVSAAAGWVAVSSLVVNEGPALNGSSLKCVAIEEELRLPQKLSSLASSMSSGVSADAQFSGKYNNNFGLGAVIYLLGGNVVAPRCKLNSKGKKKAEKNKKKIRVSNYHQGDLGIL